MELAGKTVAKSDLNTKTIVDVRAGEISTKQDTKKRFASVFFFQHSLMMS